MSVYITIHNSNVFHYTVTRNYIHSSTVRSSPDVQKEGSIPITTNAAYEMMKLGEQDGPKSGSIPTTTNTAYEMMKLGEQDGQKGGSIPTTTNTAYEMMKLGEQDGPEYEVVSEPPGTSSFLVKPDEVSSHSNQPLPDIPLPVAPPTGGNVGVAKEGEEEGVYDHISGDQ